MTENNKQVILKTPDDLKIFVQKNYVNQIKNYFGDEKQAMKFLSSMMGAVQKIPKLLECEGMTVINSFMTMAQLGLMPSDVSGEAYVLPYAGKAQFQLGYQGIVTLLYRAGVQSIRSEIVRKNDEFSFINGVVHHKIDIFKSNKDRGEAIGAYAIAVVNGEEIAKVMNKDDIIAIGKNYSKSFNTDFTPWKEKNDGELWMWKKTVLKQLAKLLPKNETINKAIAEDNKDSRISEVKGHLESGELNMGNYLKSPNENKEDKDTKEEDTGNKESQGN